MIKRLGLYIRKYKTATILTSMFVIAYILSTVRNANAIMVLEHGKIIERGYQRDLIRRKGKYYQRYTGSLELD